jgi:hypothetical protein
MRAVGIPMDTFLVRTLLVPSTVDARPPVRSVAAERNA